MKRKQYLISIACILLCCSLLQSRSEAQTSAQISVISQGNINYPLSPTPTPTSSPTPTPTSSPTPTPTPSPTPTATNLAVIPNFWSYPNSVCWGINNPSYSQYYVYPVTQAGHSNCVEMLHNLYYLNMWQIRSDRELDGEVVPIQVGDHVVFKVWLWVSDSSVGDNGQGWPAGAEIEIDLVNANGRMCALTTPDGRPAYPNWPSSSSSCYVPWGSKQWVQLTMDFVVGANPNNYPEINSQGQYEADPYNGMAGSSNQAGVFYTPTGIVPIISGYSSTQSNANSETGLIYFYGTELYVNPSTS